MSNTDWIDELLDKYGFGAHYSDKEQAPDLWNSGKAISKQEAKAAIEQKLIGARIDELERLHRYDGKDYDTELDEIIDNRITEIELQATKETV